MYSITSIVERSRERWRSLRSGSGRIVSSASKDPCRKAPREKAGATKIKGRKAMKRE